MPAGQKWSEKRTCENSVTRINYSVEFHCCVSLAACPTNECFPSDEWEKLPAQCVPSAAFYFIRSSYASHSSSTTSKSSLSLPTPAPGPATSSEACQLHYQTGAGLTSSIISEQPWWKRAHPSTNVQSPPPQPLQRLSHPLPPDWFPRVSTPKHRMWFSFPETDKTEPCNENIDILAPSTAVSVNNCQNQSLKLISIFY